jgi:hypothetical protein
VGIWVSNYFVSRAERVRPVSDRHGGVEIGKGRQYMLTVEQALLEVVNGYTHGEMIERGIYLYGRVKID